MSSPTYIQSIDITDTKWHARTDKEKRVEERVEIRNALVRACIRESKKNMEELCRIFEYSHG
jgi:hypothetical protein